MARPVSRCSSVAACGQPPAQLGQDVPQQALVLEQPALGLLEGVPFAFGCTVVATGDFNGLVMSRTRCLDEIHRKTVS
jgi:hypothetical protein